MRVLMLSWEFPPKIVGGLGIVVRDLSKGLISKGIDVKIVLPQDPGNKEKIFAGKILTLFDSQFYISYNAFSTLKKEKHQFKGNLIEFAKKYAEECVKKCSHLDFDIIHAHDWISALAGIELKKITNKPLILHIHSTEFDRAGGTYGNERVHEIEKKALEIADKVIAVSNLVKRWIVEGYGIDPSKISVVHNVIDKENFPEPMKEKKNVKVVMYVGRLSWMKGVDYFLMAAKKVIEHYKNVRFVVVGTGEMMHDLINEACRLGIADKVSFEGYVSRDEILKRYYPNADVLVVPSRSEPFGLIALEAGHYSLPIIISKQSGVSEVINHTFKVDYWDTEEMANKILALLKHEVLHREMRNNIKKEISRLNIEKITNDVINIYREVGVKW